MWLTRLRQWPALLAIAALVALAGCQAPRTLAPAIFTGAIVGDEAHAMLAARQALAAGGSAADAAVALTLALAVTYPSVASLGGGGQCLVHRRHQGGDTIEALDFLPGHAAVQADGAAEIAVPGTVRGMAALQARFGRLPWARTLFAAENLARFGHPVSRALADDLATGGDALVREPAARAIFARSDGRLYAQSGTIIQHDLAALLKRLRVDGADDFYTGGTARLLLESVASAGGTLEAEDLAGYQPRWRGTVAMAADDRELHTAPGAGGTVAVSMWGLGGADGRYAEAGDAERYHLLAEATRRSPARELIEADVVLEREAFADIVNDVGTPSESVAGQELSNVRTTSFAIVDRSGMAVACGLTMNGLFGAGRLAPGTGIILAAPLDSQLAPPISPVVLVDRSSRQMILAASGGGDGAAPGALAAVLLAVIDGELPLDKAVLKPRIQFDETSGRLAVESSVDPAARSGLKERGHRVVEVPVIGRVNAIHCPDGVSRDPQSCRTASDRRRYGVTADKTH